MVRRTDQSVAHRVPHGILVFDRLEAFSQSHGAHFGAARRSGRVGAPSPARESPCSILRTADLSDNLVGRLGRLRGPDPGLWQAVLIGRAA